MPPITPLVRDSFCKWEKLGEVFGPGVLAEVWNLSDWGGLRAATLACLPGGARGNTLA